MRRLLLTAVSLLIALAIPAFAQSVSVPTPDGWQPADEEYTYGPDNLWEPINGAAELFLSYGFRELKMRDFEQGIQFISISIYDMGSPLNAYGIFERETGSGGEHFTSPGASTIIQAPYQGLMLKDRFYVKLDAASGELDAGGFHTLLQSVARSLPGGNDLPKELSYLPEEHRQPGTVAFTNRDFLGFADLSGVISARYQDPNTGTEYQLFSFRPGKDVLGNLSRQWTVKEDGDTVMAWREVPYQGFIVIGKQDEKILGLAGLEYLEESKELLQTWF